MNNLQSGTVLTEKTAKITKKGITPINQESAFDIADLFFSKTDRLSTILFANDIFAKVSKYDFEDMVGNYHNMIRHPEMPKAAFRVMWEYLNDSQPVAVYVKNMASDGSYYWVIALAFPVADGFLSIRLKPTSPLFAKVKGIYSDVLAYENELLHDLDRENAIQASKAYLLEALQKEGFENYDKFMRFALMTEIYHRQSELAKRGINYTYLNDFDRELGKTNSIMAEMVLLADKLSTMHGKLISHSKFILHLSQTILSIAINARLQSSKLDQADHSLSVISEKMGEQTQWGEENLNRIINTIEEIYSLFDTLNFNVISSKIQIEMTLRYFWEYKSKEEAEGFNQDRFNDFETTKEILADVYRPLIKMVQENIADVPALQNQINTGMKDIEKYLTILRFIYITGKVEITRMTQQDASFQETFEDLIQELETADEHLSNLRGIINENNSLFSRYAILNQQLRELQN